MEDRCTKPCKACFEAIDARAIRCPFCRHPQRRVPSWCAKHPISFSIILAVLAIGTLVVLEGWSERAMRRFFTGQNGEPYRGQIKLISAELAFGESKKGPTVSLIGKLRNNSTVTWKDIRLEAQFFDESGELIDCAKDRIFFYSAEMLPGEECAFKVRALRDFPPEKYAKGEVVVASARDAKTPP